MFRCGCTINRQRTNSCSLKLQLLRYCVKIHWCVVNTVVVWLQLHHHHRNFSEHELMRSLMIVQPHRNMSELF